MATFPPTASKKYELVLLNEKTPIAKIVVFPFVCIGEYHSKKLTFEVEKTFEINVLLYLLYSRIVLLSDSEMNNGVNRNAQKIVGTRR